ncbi:hypothetical protein TNCV_385171 [Trichonephila clavipes]|nr:hypothetical protein TNCV_385171 [Trichonephila clavipes]
MENASAATESQVSVVSYSSLSAFNMSDALVRLNEMYTAKECNDFCEMLEELIFNSSDNCDSVPGLEELRLINNVSWICIRSARKANLLLAKEHHQELMAIGANQSPSPAVKPGTAKKSKPSEEVIALSNFFSEIAPIDENDDDFSISEDTVVDTAPGTEEETNSSQAPVEDPSNVDMNEDEQEKSDEPLLADDASGQTSSSTKDIQPKKRTPPIVIDEQYNTPGLLLEIMKKLKSHTYETAGEKQLKTVIRGLPSDFDVDEIIQELGTHKITPEHDSVMRNRKQNKNMPLFLVVSRKCPANQAIFQVTSIGHYKIKVEPLD